jgi:hypothetical protein
MRLVCGFWSLLRENTREPTMRGVHGAALLQAGVDQLAQDWSRREFNIQRETALALGRAEEGMTAIEEAIGRVGIGE